MIKMRHSGNQDLRVYRMNLNKFWNIGNFESAPAKFVVERPRIQLTMTEKLGGSFLTHSPTDPLAAKGLNYYELLEYYTYIGSYNVLYTCIRNS